MFGASSGTCISILLLLIFKMAIGEQESAYGPTSTSCSAKQTIEQLLEYIAKYYNRSIRPGIAVTKDNATLVWINVYLQSFSSISVDRMEYEVDFYLRQVWQDPRLAYEKYNCKLDRITLDSRMADLLWLPDVFFPNEKKAHIHEVTLTNRLIRIYPNGTLQYSTRISASVSCQMNLIKFPLDVQNCNLRMESYGYTKDELEFRWANGVDPVEVIPNLEMPQFSMDLVNDIKSHRCEKLNAKYSTGEFTCLQVDFHLTRQYGYYIIQTYIPSILIVILSWVSFWITIDAVPARISLGVLTVLNVTTQSAGLWMTLPRVSYIKAIDLWMSTCVIFVFSAMLEFAFVNTLVRKEVRRMTLRLKAKQNQDMSSSDAVNHALKDITYGSSNHPSNGGGNRKLARQVDKASRIVFPATFITFNICYWLIYYLI